MANVHPDFNAGDADAIIQSADGVQFHLHRENLKFCTGAFPGNEYETRGHAVILTEPANVLQILFQFVYPKRHPNLNDQDFETVAAIAEAAGKYEVFSAINTCIDRLIQILPDHSEELLLLGIKHDFMDLINEAALHIPLAQIVSTAEKMPALWIIPWLNFTERIKAETFGRIQEDIERCHSVAVCSKNNRESTCACSSCRYSICCWIHSLELQSMRAALDSTVHVHEIPRTGHCQICKEVPKWCCYVPGVVELFKKGFEAIPRLSDFKMHPEKYSRLPSPRCYRYSRPFSKSG